MQAENKTSGKSSSRFDKKKAKSRSLKFEAHSPLGDGQFTDVLRFDLVVCVNATRAKAVWSGCAHKASGSPRALARG